ncbi:MAG: DUF3330 domain-containing protein [Chromatiales bacterium]|nr:DUF3330 domain-containing protein [Chromatiales bacterium]MDX9766878.1 DUF3330 domain-containing protein [Ectothiorhodospiraceae bacterium]
MHDPDDSPQTEDMLLACEVCLREIPHSVAQHAEGEEYVHHFCGLACYGIWQQSQDPPAPDDAD